MNYYRLTRTVPGVDDSESLVGEYQTLEQAIVAAEEESGDLVWEWFAYRGLWPFWGTHGEGGQYKYWINGPELD